MRIDKFKERLTSYPIALKGNGYQYAVIYVDQELMTGYSQIDDLKDGEQIEINLPTSL